MKEIKVRDALPEDVPVLLAFEQALIIAERPFDPCIRPDPVSYYDLAAYVGDDTVKVVVAEIDGEIVGSGYAIAKKARPYLDHVDYAYLGFMYTKPSHRGQGINKMIINTLVDWSRGKGLEEIRLTVYDDNLPAIKAYQKAGFKKHIAEMRLTTDK
ncbi:GNAT family N-acetyltransferase [Flagellimonas lutaonensis]|uniref:N-acetyltransferase GCN5 n=1 Tax=Flagellimonas lutaonensis TaxID=516051 RepID=A0A0D5YTV1_9FLAO|nr:GNAT family N-acetyltransferase [Allomuricauda lutaonensis]AKA35757.1 N-acetyltransferase GCN5 [Allomuricauda lutaonensis]